MHVMHACDDGRSVRTISIRPDDETIMVEPQYGQEQHPLLVPEGSRARYIDSGSVWLKGDHGKVNTTCVEALQAAMNGDHEEAKNLFVDAAEQGSHWGAHYAAIYHLCEKKVPEASDYFKRALKKNNTQTFDSLVHVTALLGLQNQEEKYKFINTFDAKILASLGKEKADIAHSLALCAAQNGQLAPLNMIYEDETIRPSLLNDTALTYQLIASNKDKLASYSEEILKQFVPVVDAMAASKNVSSIQALLQKALSEKANKYNSQYVSGLLNRAKGNDLQAQREIGLYYINNPSEKNKKRTVEGWDWLKKAADSKHAPAVCDFAVLALKSGDSVRVKSALDMVNDPMFLTQTGLSLAQGGTVAVAIGDYYLKNNQRNDARRWLGIAHECGNNARAFEYARLCWQNGVDGDLPKAEEQYQYVEGVFYDQGQWDLAVLRYIKSNTADEKQELLRKIAEPLIHHSLAASQMEPIISHQRARKALQEDDSALALLVQGCTAQNGWIQDETKSAADLAYECYTKALAMKSVDQQVNDVCIERLRELEERGHEPSHVYVRENNPTEQQKQIAALYAAVNEMNAENATIIVQRLRAQLGASKAIADGLKKYPKKNDVKELAIAQYLMAMVKMQEGASQKKEAVLKQSLTLLEGVKGIDNALISASKREALFALAACASDEKIKYQWIEKLANENDPEACWKMYSYLNGKATKKASEANIEEKAQKYLSLAIAAHQPDAMLWSAEAEYVKAAGSDNNFETCKSLLEAMERNSENYGDDIKRRLYEFKALVCENQEERIACYRSAAQYGSTRFSFMAAHQDILEGNYAAAAKALKNDCTDETGKKYVPLMQAFVNYQLDNTNEHHKKAFYSEYAHSLRKTLYIEEPAALKELHDAISKTMNTQEVTVEVRKDGPEVSAESLERLEMLMWVHYLGVHGKKDYEVTYAIVNEILSRVEDPVNIYEVLADFWVNGYNVCEVDINTVTVLLIKSLAAEKDLERHRYNRGTLAGILRKNPVLFETENGTASLKKLYNSIAKDKRPDNEIDTFLMNDIVDSCLIYAAGNSSVADVLEWLPRMDPSNPWYSYYEGWLRLNNAYKKPQKNLIEEGSEGVELMENAANKGILEAQDSLVTLFEHGKEFSSGIIIGKNSAKSSKYARQMVKHPNAANEQKVCGYLCLTRRAIIVQEDGTAPMDIQKAAYNEGIEAAQNALNLGEYGVLGHYMRIQNNAGFKDRAAALFEQYGDQKSIWSSYAKANLVATEVIEHNKAYLKDVCVKFKDMPDDDGGQHSASEAKFYIKLVDDIVHEKPKIIANPAAYGFNDQEEIETVLPAALAKMKQHINKLGGKKQKSDAVIASGRVTANNIDSALAKVMASATNDITNIEKSVNAKTGETKWVIKRGETNNNNNNNNNADEEVKLTEYDRAFIASQTNKNASEILALLENAANTGDARAQNDLVNAYSMGCEFPSGAKVGQDMEKAHYWSHLMLNNNMASPVQKAPAHLHMGHCAVALMKIANESTDEEKKNNLYNDALNHYQQALTAGNYKAVLYIIKVHDDAGYGNKAVEFYKQYENDPNIWGNYMQAYPVAEYMVEAHNAYGNDVCIRLCQSLEKPIMPDEDIETVANVVSAIGNFMEATFKKALENPAAYGFGSKEAVAAFKIIAAKIIGEKNLEISDTIIKMMQQSADAPDHLKVAKDMKFAMQSALNVMKKGLEHEMNKSKESKKEWTNAAAVAMHAIEKSQKDIAKLQSASQKAENNHNNNNMLLNGSHNVQLDQQKALEKLINDMGSDLKSCTPEVRTTLLGKLDENMRDAQAGKVETFYVTPETATQLEKIYLFVSNQKTQTKEDQKLLLTIPLHMCEYHAMDNPCIISPAVSPTKLKMWCSSLQKRYLDCLVNNDDTQTLTFAGVPLDARIEYFQAFTQMYTEKNGAKIVESFEKAAELGDPSAQWQLMMMHAMGRAFQSGAKVAPDPIKALKAAEALLANSTASKREQATAHVHMGQVLATIVRRTQDQQNKENAYRAAIAHYQEAQKVKPLVVIGEMMDLHVAAGCPDKAIALYEQYRDDKEIWEDYLTSFAVASRIFDIGKQYGKEACTRLLKLIKNPIAPHENLDILSQATEYMQAKAGEILKKAAANPAEHGFKDHVEVVALQTVINNAIKIKDKKIKDAQKAMIL
jgi:hypothetical protein